MEKLLEQLIWERADSRCEYCQVPQLVDELSHHTDHIIAQQHGGETVSSNLALACYSCTLHKGPNLAGRDPQTRKIVRLFNPRRQRWNLHFRWNGAVLVGQTAIGRATIATLAINLSIVACGPFMHTA